MEQKQYDVGIFHPDDSAGVAQLFRTVYGEGYPVKLVYNPDQLVSAFEQKENIPIVARMPGGKIAGYMALFRSTPNPKLYEAGQGLVLPEYRSLGISSAINNFLYEKVGNELGLDAIFGEPVCNHIYMQRTCVNLKNIETAIEVDLMPAEAYVQEGSASGRVAVLSVFRIYKPALHTVHIPAIYEEQFRYIYKGLDDPRKFAASTPKVPDTQKTEVNIQIFDFAKVARMAFHRAGFDFADVFDEHEKDLISRDIIVIQVWLKLSEPWVGETVKLLRERKYFFGGILPRWFDEDGILMQKIMGRPNWEGITLYTDHARQILALAKKDWSEVQ